jgi:CheY-like chemotaxis protein
VTPAPRGQSVVILLAEDDEDDFFLTQSALRRARLLNTLIRVKDGEELMDYLHHRGAFADPASSPTPGVILLDLNMPRKSGREALREIKVTPGLRHIPVVVLTTSRADEDIFRSYDLGVNSFITKPVGFDQLAETVRVLGRYWFEIVELPVPPETV